MPPEHSAGPPQTPRSTPEPGVPNPADLESPPGPSAPLEALFSSAYDELRRLAGYLRRGDANATLNPTALVNEAWLKLAPARDLQVSSKLHFKRIAARAMRQVLVESARRRKASKRGGAGIAFVTLDDQAEAWGASISASSSMTAEQLLHLDRALDGLARLEPRQARMVEYRFFGGLDVEETADLLGVSAATVLRDWRAARAWLTVELGRAR